MVNPVSAISSISQILPNGSSNSANQTGPDFKKALSDAINSVNSTVEKSDQMAEDFATGKTSDIHTVVVQAEKADIELQLTADVTNKIITAYQSIMNMQI